MTIGQLRRALCFALLLACWHELAQPCRALGDQAQAAEQPPSDNGSLYLKVQMEQDRKLSKMKPGEIVDGVLARDVYAGDRELFTAGERVRLTVDRTEKRKRIPNDHWPWVVKAFTPRHESYPVFKVASVGGADGEKDLRVALLSVSRPRAVQAQAKKNGAAGAVETTTKKNAPELNSSAKSSPPVMVLEGFPEKANGEERERKPLGDADLAGMQSLNAGTRFKILLLGEVSASKSRAGDGFQARLLEPVTINAKVVIPAGSLLDGKILKKTPPRWGSRAGSLSLAFTGLTLPGGNRIPIAASLAGAELDQRSHTKIDSEGQLHGERPGKAWMAINIGVTAGLAKEADDATQLIIEAIVATATDASTAGTSRIVSSCVSGIYMVSRHGRDVLLPRFTEMDISLDRPVTVNRASGGASGVLAAGN
jgi:hypothetical protein